MSVVGSQAQYQSLVTVFRDEDAEQTKFKTYKVTDKSPIEESFVRKFLEEMKFQIHGIKSEGQNFNVSIEAEPDYFGVEVYLEGKLKQIDSFGNQKKEDLSWKDGYSSYLQKFGKDKFLKLEYGKAEPKLAIGERKEGDKIYKTFCRSLYKVEFTEIDQHVAIAMYLASNPSDQFIDLANDCVLVGEKKS